LSLSYLLSSVIGIIGFVVLKEYSIGKPIPPQYRFAPQEYHQPTDKHHRNTKLEGVAPTAGASL